MHTESGSELRIILGPDTTALYWSQWGILEVKGKMDFWSSPPLNGPSENTHYGYFLSGSGKIELSCKLIRIRRLLLAWNFFKALQLKQRIRASCSNMV